MRRRSRLAEKLRKLYRPSPPVPEPVVIGTVVLVRLRGTEANPVLRPGVIVDLVDQVCCHIVVTLNPDDQEILPLELYPRGDLHAHGCLLEGQEVGQWRRRV